VCKTPGLHRGDLCLANEVMCPGAPDTACEAIDGDTVVIGAWTRNYTNPEEAGVVFVGRIP
jgi:hypothetical protein